MMQVTHNMIEVDGYFVDLGTGQVWIEKRSKRGRHYLSTITSPRRIKKALKLAKAKSEETNVGQIPNS